MRRWFATLLLALLPLQFSWAAIATYCEHETGVQAQHLGHHEHDHEHQHVGQAGVVKDSTPDDQSAPAALDFDCGHCHGTCVSLPAPVDELAPLALALHPVTSIAGALRTLPQSPPERPQWLPLA